MDIETVREAVDSILDNIHDDINLEQNSLITNEVELNELMQNAQTNSETNGTIIENTFLRGDSSDETDLSDFPGFRLLSSSSDETTRLTKTRILRKRTSKNICPTCKTIASSAFLKCEICEVREHINCCQLNEDLVNKINRFLCLKCEDRHGQLTEWKERSILTRNQAGTKSKDFYQVSKIVEHKVENDLRYFKIRWAKHNEKDDSWEPETNLIGCSNTLQAYCRRNKISWSKINGLMGGNLQNKSCNPQNWVSMSTVIKVTKTLRSIYKCSLNIYEYEEDMSEEGIYFLEFNFHCSVILNYLKPKRAIIADGTNQFRDNVEVRKAIRKLLKRRLSVVSYNQQVGIDHCGSSAACIALALLLVYKNGADIITLTVPASIRKYVNLTLNKSKSEPIYLQRTNLKDKRIFTCECGRKFTKSNAFQLHANRKSHFYKSIK